MAANIPLVNGLYTSALSHSRKPSRRAAAARCNRRSHAVARRLAMDSLSEVRVSVANNPGTPPDIMRILSNDDDPRVWMLAASHPSTPPDALHRLAGVLGAISANGSTVAGTYTANSLLAQLVRNPNAQEYVLLRILSMRVHSPAVLNAVLDSPEVSGRLMSKMAEWVFEMGISPQYGHLENEIDDLMIRVGGHKRTPSETLLKLGMTGGRDLRERILIRPDLPDSMRQMLVFSRIA